MTGYFEGWYLKQQSKDGALALIPAVHTARDGKRSASLQIVHPSGSYSIPCERFAYSRARRTFQLDGSVFTPEGCMLRVHTREVVLTGRVDYSALAVPRHDIMGPFRFAPMMQCRHLVFSMAHRVDGVLTLNGRRYRFLGGQGYIEGDRGASFPERYVWTQCGWDGNCVMISAASIPWMGLSFTGCIAFVYTGGREYRLATYLGAKVERADNHSVALRQGRYTLSARLLESRNTPLRAPVLGEMRRIIHESVACKVAYQFRDGEKEIFSIVRDHAGFEGVWEDGKTL